MWSVSRALAGVLAVVMWGTLVGLSGAVAQGADEPDLESGWQLRLEEPMPVGTMVAGSAEAGFVVRHFDDVFWSPDGIDWQSVVSSTGPNIGWGLASTDDGFVGVPNFMPATRVLFSPDGRSWDTVDVGGSADFLRVQSGPAGFVLIGMKDCEVSARFSPNGRNWSPVDFPEGCNSLLAAPLGDGWIGVAEMDDEIVVLSSDDGIRWVDIDAAVPPPALPSTLSFFPGYEELQGIASLTSNGETLVLAGVGAEGMWVSSDRGNTWEPAELILSRGEMAAGDLGFVGVSGPRVLHSADGRHWAEHWAGIEFRDVVVVGDTIVAVAADGIYTWTAPAAELALTGTYTRRLLVVAGVLIALGGLVLVAQQRLTVRRDKLTADPSGP